MTVTEEPIDSPHGWVAEHVRRYIETNGEDGHIWKGAPTLILTTRGRRTGKPRRLALIYTQDGERYAVVASNGGADHHPEWYLNILEHPQVEIQVKADRFRAKARTATADERQGLWDRMAAIWPDYNKYQAKTPREIPVVILDRI